MRRTIWICFACFLVIMLAGAAFVHEEILANDGGTSAMEKAVFAAGCFWGVEAAFRKVTGVLSTTVGFSGGTLKNPTYEQVCAGTTGHAESVKVEYDPAVVSYEELLHTFWNIHDPTTLNRQGPDVGTQYRSAIFYRSKAQKDKAITSRDEYAASGRYTNKIVTEITPFTAFYKAEEHHQRFLEKRGISE